MGKHCEPTETGKSYTRSYCAKECSADNVLCIFSAAPNCQMVAAETKSPSHGDSGYNSYNAFGDLAAGLAEYI